MKPYVERYQRTADSVAQIVQAFSLTILSTDMSGILANGESDANLWLRAGIFNRFRENSGLMLLDKESEVIDQINTPLTSLPDLLTKSQEQMAGPSHTPLVKLLGVTPDGIGNSTDGEIRVYYDYIMAQNEAHIGPIIKTFSDLIQLNLFGEIDPAIKWEFNPLYQLNELELAQVQETKGRNAKQLVEAAIVSPQEARVTLSKDEQSPFNSIDVDDVPEGQGMDDDAFSDDIDDKGDSK
jgi:phage-related protein (TIGR01555 family)